MIACAAVFVVLGATGAFAGEVTGNGKDLKDSSGNLNGRSACAFSGQQDNAEEDEGIFKSDRTQNWGQLTDFGRWIFATFLGITRADQGCNPNKAAGDPDQ